METKNFLGLDGLKRFWEKAKTWIVNEITAKIAEIVAEAPEDLDTLKEIADWISTHEDSASAMNTNIKKNQSDINELNNKLSSIEQTNFKAIFDLVRPIGDTYVQYPQQVSPNELWGAFSTWQVINYDGAFFRAEGTNANAFIKKTDNLVKQGEGLPNIMGSIPGCYFRGSSSMTFKGVFSTTSFRSTEFAGYKSLYGRETEHIMFDASSSNSIYGKSIHVTPENYTIRIWKRIA